MSQLCRWSFAILAIATMASATQDEFNKGFTLGQQAYFYGLPLSIMQYTFEVDNSTTPVNQFSYSRSFSRPTENALAPNFDTLYGMAWLDLSEGPVVIHLPNELYSTANGVEKRYWVIAMYDPYTNNFQNLGSVTFTQPGDYAITWLKLGSIQIPGDLKRVDSDFDRVAIIQRIYAINNNTADIQFVNSLQDLITLTPLSNFSFGDYQGGNSSSASSSTPSIPTGMAFYDQLCELLVKFPPPSADNQFLSNLIPIGVLPGLKPSKNISLSTDTVAGMVAAVSNGSTAIMAEVMKIYETNFVAHNGYLILPMGAYGTDYTLRVIAAKIGLGALSPSEAIYPIALYDRRAKPLLSTNNYQIHIPAGGLPPVNGFWSITIYTTSGFVVPNEINRYVINDRSTLHYNADGSLDIFIQATAPSNPNQAQNWLPAPANAAFELIWRLYALKPAEIPGVLSGQGWQPPAITNTLHMLDRRSWPLFSNFVGLIIHHFMRYK